MAHDLAGPVMSISMSVSRRWRSSLNFYSACPDVFDQQACLTAGLFGLQAATLLYGADHAAGLKKALQTRDVIGQAKGVLMERFDLTDEAAFQKLVASSQETNMKLHVVASWLIQERGRRDSNIIK